MASDSRTVIAFGSPSAAIEPGAKQLESDLVLMKGYLQMCVRKEDWHGVMDAAADIREIVAKLFMLRVEPTSTSLRPAQARPLTPDSD